ncbi:MAG: Tim44/TimA family putative adaptor protein [Alphaproteobacteria bacterium]|nr:Tim44/TimA family putative adaptor protein [Alphaproteobacteria bacterium]
MSGGFEYFDIILFAMIAAFLVYRLGSVLGKRTGHERQGRDPFSPVGGEDGQSADAGNDNVVTPLPRNAEPEEKEPDTPLGATITQIKVADPTFTRKTFLEGARKAFEMVITAFALGDMKTLRSLLSDEVYENFSTVIRDRERSSQTQETTLVGIDTADILEAQLDGSVASVTVKFVSQQVNATRDESGKVIDGDPNGVDQVTDIWTFSRDTSGSDPNWALVATRSPN